MARLEMALTLADAAERYRSAGVELDEMIQEAGVPRQIFLPSIARLPVEVPNFRSGGEVHGRPAHPEF